MAHVLHEVHDRLLAAFGPQNWWPGDSPFEILVGAILVQNTSWKNVEKAIRQLKEADLLGPHQLHSIPPEELESWVRPAGYYRLKARRLHNLLSFLVHRYDGSTEAMFSQEQDLLRRELLEITGVGPETADSILLYAGNMPAFVVDTYTHRVLARHGWIGFDADYYQIQEYFQAHLPEDVPLYNEYHALLVRLGHLHCRKTPRCDNCPLEDLLPGDAPLTPDA